MAFDIGASSNIYARKKSKTAGTSLDLDGASSGSEIAQGELIVVAFGGDNVDTVEGDTSVVSTITDTGGNTYFKVREFTNGAAAAASTFVSIWYAIASTAVVKASAMITINHTSLAARAGVAYPVSFAAGTRVSAVATTALATDAANVASLTLSGLTSASTLFWGAWGHEGPDGDVWGNPADWNLSHNYDNNFMVLTSGGGAASNNGIGVGIKVVSSVASTWAASAASRDHAGILVAFQEKALGTSIIPVAADAIHTVSAPGLVQANTLQTVGATAGHTVTAGGLAQLNSLIAVAATQGHTATPTTLVRVLPVVSPTAGHTVTAGGLQQLNVLVSVPGTQGHTVASPALVKHLLVVPATQGHTADTVDLTPQGALIAVDTTQGHTVAPGALLQAHILPVASGTQGHTVAAGGLAQNNILISVATTQGHTTTAPALIANLIVRAADVIAGHIADPGTLALNFSVSVANATTGHIADVGVIQVFVPGQTTAERTFVVLEDGRILEIAVRGEALHIVQELRQLSIGSRADTVH